MLSHAEQARVKNFVECADQDQLDLYVDSVLCTGDDAKIEYIMRLLDSMDAEGIDDLADWTDWVEG